MDQADPQTRTSRASDGSILWSPGDAIKLFSAGETAEFVSQNTEPAAQAQFKGYIAFVSGAGEDGTVNYTWALYPYREDAVFDPGQDAVVTTLPDFQKSKARTFADDMALSLGKSTSMAFSFKNAYSGLRLRFYRSDIVSVTVKGMDNEVLAGKVAIGLTPNPVIKTTPTPVRSITMIPEDGTFLPTTSGNDNDYYVITLPDIDLQRGVAITLHRKDGFEGTYYHSTTKLERNRFKNLTEPVDTRLEKQSNIDSGVSTGWVTSTTQAPNEIWYTTSDNSAVTYTPDSSTGNEIEEILAPTGTDGYGIIRFKTPVKETDSYCFGRGGNANLTKVILPETVETINPNSFYGCNNMSTLEFQGVLKTIRSSAFYNCGITGFWPGEGLETIEANAFIGCRNLTAVGIPESVTSIGKLEDKTALSSPFLNCNALVSFSGKYASQDGRAIIVDDQLLSFAPGGMTGETYVVPANVKHIAMHAFQQTTIGGVILPEGLETIQDYAFYYCSRLKNVTIPSTVETLYYCAFFRCSALEWIEIKRADKVMATGTHYSPVSGIFDRTNDCPIYVPANAINWYKYGQYWDEYGCKLDEDGDENTSCRYQTALTN